METANGSSAGHSPGAEVAAGTMDKVFRRHLAAPLWVTVGLDLLALVTLLMLLRIPLAGLVWLGRAWHLDLPPSVDIDLGVGDLIAPALLLGMWGALWVIARQRAPELEFRLSAAHLTARYGAEEPVSIELSRVGRAEHLTLSGEVVLLDRDGGRVATLPRSWGTRYRSDRELIDAINARLA